MDPDHESRLRRSASNNARNSSHPQQTPQPAPPHQSNIVNTYANGPPVGASNNYESQNPQPVNPLQGHHLQSHPSNVASSYPGGNPVGASTTYDEQNPQSANPPRVNQLQSYPSNVAGSYRGGPQVGVSNDRGLQNQRLAGPAVNPPYAHAAHQISGYSNNAVDPYPARSPVGVDGVSIGQTSPNPQVTRMGNRNPEMTGQQLPTPVPALHRSLSSQRSSSGQGWNTGNLGASVSGVQGQQYIQGAPTGSSRCRIPDCRQSRFFDNRIQEQLDYCEPHLAYAITSRFAAACRRCGRLPVLQHLDYCSLSCSNADTADRLRVQVRQQPIVTASVPMGFAPACQECRRPITENTDLYEGRFCSRQCWNAHRSSRH